MTEDFQALDHRGNVRHINPKTFLAGSSPPRSRSSLVPEANFQAAVCEVFRLRGWRVYHNPDSRRSDAGWPDLQLLKAPYLVFAELKVPGGKVKPVQDMVINELRSAGQEVYVWYPEDWDEIEKVVNR